MNLVTLKNKIKSGVVVGGLLVTIVPNLVSADQVEPHNDPIWNRYGYVTVDTPIEPVTQEVVDNSQTKTTSDSQTVDAERKAAEDLANYWAHYDWSKHVSSWSNSSTSYNRYGYIMYP